MTTALEVVPKAAWHMIPFVQAPTSQLIRLHAGIRHVVEGRAREAFAASDLVSEREWLNSPINSLMRGDWGRNQQLVIPMEPSVRRGETEVWVLGRFSTAFGPRDREAAIAITPILRAVTAHRRVMVHSGLDTAAADVLTGREAAVLGLQSQGLGALAIARRLGISTRTVQKHVEHIYRKLGVHSQREAVQAGWPKSVALT